MASIWQETAQLPTFPALSDNLQTDVLIIGGGMAGLLCAYKLQQAGIKYALVEAKAIGSGHFICRGSNISPFSIQYTNTI